MNNNRGNNRRRGRGNRQGGGGGGQQLNRIDSRARGNAPQLLEKYRKLAQDAHLNGDRVTAEYYLQFADHYFRVIADQRLRQEEQRNRRDERWQDNGEGEREEGDEAGEFAVDSDFPSFDQPVYSRREREDRPRQQRPSHDERDDAPRGPRRERAAADEPAEAAEAGNSDAAARDNPYEPADNPFVRDNRGSRGLRPRRERDERPRRSEDDAGPGLDPSLLPPAIGAARGEGDAGDAGSEGEAAEAKPRRGRPRKPRAGETLEPVN